MNPDPKREQEPREKGALQDAGGEPACIRVNVRQCHSRVISPTVPLPPSMAWHILRCPASKSMPTRAHMRGLPSYLTALPPG